MTNKLMLVVNVFKRGFTPLVPDVGKTKVLIILIFLSVFGGISAQKSVGTFTATPEAADVMRRIDFPAANHTGIVSTTLPLYQVQLNGFSMDISLQYVAKGIQVEEVASSVGLGWSLNAGGMVTRAVRGEPDDYNKNREYSSWEYGLPRVGRFWAGNGKLIKDFVETSKNYSDVEKKLKDISVGTTISGYSYQGKNDMEPDIFYFKCNDLSGQFLFDVDANGKQTVKMIPYQDVKITHKVDEKGEIQSFTIKDMKGNTYYFEVPERVWRQERRTQVYRNSVDNSADDGFSDIWDTHYNLAWHLSKITTKDGQTIVFSYTNEGYALPDNSVQDIRPFSSNYIDSSSGTIVCKNTKKRLTRISTPHEEINFHASSEERKDLINPKEYGNAYPISKIEVKSSVTSSVVKSFSLKYDYFQSSGATTQSPYHYKRLKLVSLREAGVGTHQFKYSNVELPYHYSSQQDFWGFFNGVSTNKHLQPCIWYYPKLKGSERFSLYNLGSKQELGWAYTTAEGAADRQPRLSYATAGMLTGIIHPEGGRSEFEYELNEFTYQGEKRRGGGIRIKSIKKYDREFSTTPALEKHYTYENGKIITMPVYGFFIGLRATKSQFQLFIKSQVLPGTTQGGFVGYETVKVREGMNTKQYGETEYQYSLPGTYGESGDGRYYNAPKSYVLGTDLTEDLTNATGINVFPYAPHPEYDWNRGLLLRKKEYDLSGKLVRETSYLYSFYFPNNAKAPEMVHGLKFSSGNLLPNRPPYIVFFSKYENPTQAAKVLTYVEENVYEPNSTSPVRNITQYSYSPVHLNPVSIEKTGNVLGEYLITNYKYAMDYSVPGMLDTDAAGQLVKHRINNLVEKTEFVAKGGIRYLLSSTIDDYQATIYPTATLSLKTNVLGTSFKPSSDEGMTTITKDSRYQTEVTYRRYDVFGNCLEMSDKKGLYTVVLWSYKGKYPVAIIKNASYSEVSSKLGTTFINGLSAKILPAESDFNQIKSLRSSLPKAEVTTFTYKHLVGLVEENNPQGVSTFYTYDSYGRLSTIDHMENNIKRSRNKFTYEEYSNY